MTDQPDAATAHVDALTRTWLGLPADRDVPRLPDALARRLLRLEEHEHSHRDQWGNWEFGFCAAFREGRLLEPDLDRWLLDRRRELGADAESLWPDNRPFAICLSHDVDLIADTVTPGQALRSMRLSLLDTDTRLVRFARPGVRAARALANGVSRAPVAESLERCFELEQASGVTSTYFFTAYPGDGGHRYDCTYDFGDACRFGGVRVTVADVIRMLDREGFEIGLHGSYNSALAPDRLVAEKQALEGATGLAVTSTRQHFLHWDIRTTPRLQAETGLAADSTLGFNRNIGFRAGTSLPFRIFDVDRGRSTDLVEVPFAVHDGALLRSDALELGRELAGEVLRDTLDRVAAVGGLATLIFHPNNLDDPDYLDLFQQTIEYGRERDAWFASVGDLGAWWRAREQGSGDEH